MFIAAGQISAAQPHEQTAVNIEFDSPSGCSSVDAFYEGVHGRTDRVRWATEGESAVQIRIRLFRAGPKIKGELRLSDQEGEKETRKVDGATCDEVVEALSLTVTLALDPSALVATSRNVAPSSGATGNLPTQSGPMQPGQPGQRPPNAPGNGRERLQHSASDQTELGAQMMVASLISPGVSIGPAVEGRYIVPKSTWSSWSIGLKLFHLQNDFLKTAEHGAFGLTALAFELCPLRFSATYRVDLAMCAPITGGWLRATGLAVSHTYTVGRSWWSVGLQSASSLMLADGLRLELSVGADAPLIHREFTVNEPSEPIAHSRWLVFQGALGLAYRF